MFFSLSSPLASKALLPQPPSPPLLPFNPFLPPLRRPCLRLQTPRVLPRAAASPAEDAALPKSAIRRIAEKLRTLGYLEEEERQEGGRASDAEEARGSAGEIFIPVPRELPKRRVGHTLDPSWSTPERPVPVPGSGTAIVRFHELRREAGRQMRDAPVEKEETPMVAELVIPADELRRLRGLGIRLNKRMKIGKAGITEGIVNGIHERWRHSELVKIKCEDLCRLNMKRTHEILERKTGGLVIWRSGSIIILYRGINYKYPYFTDDYSDENLEASSEPSVEKLTSGQEGSQLSIADTNFIKSTRDRHPSHGSLVIGVGSPKKVRFQLPGESQLEEEADQLLDGLGPRFTDWWGYDPLPVDADLLPAVVPSLRRPFRLLPFGVQPKLTDREMTILRRLSRPLPCHFALGRNRNLQGLAASIIKLWEKCEIAKIAVKRGVQNTNSELMAEELKRLTGGTLLSRDKDFIVFYRGKDFLPLAVSNAVAERRNHVMHKEKLGVGITESSSTIPVSDSESPVESVTSVQPQQTNTQKKSLSTEGKWSSTKAAVQSIDDRLSKAIDKKMKAEKLLKELEEPAVSHKPEMDKEAISEEERYMLRKVGLRMKPFLLLGRRGAFDGTVENMHLHWKYRELVKIISRNRPVEETYATARTLEAASGGILVAVERVNKGYAIIVYRGKNYRRPTNLRPQTLLNKKEAFNHYLENQRRESLKLHVLKLSQDIELMKQKRVNRDKEVDRMQSAASNESDIISQALDSSISLQTDDQSSIQSMGMDEFPTAEMENDIISVYANENPPALSFMEHEEKMDGKNVKKLPEMETMQLYSEHVFKTNEQDNDETSAADLEKGNFSIDAEGPILKSAEHKDMLNIEHEHGFSKAETTQSFCDPRSEANITDTEENAKKEACPGVRTSFKAAPLSNKERLILRKQALSMKYRPVLAVGRNNVVTGVAKTIKVHFRKHPLAIVNIKGIAKGTSVREVIFELERATGAVLVSREPSKIILYRGWGEREESRSAKKKKLGKEPTPSTDVKEIPSKLMNAIRVESGLQLSEEVLHEEEVTPSSENSEP